MTSLNVTTRTSATKRVGRYMSHTQASRSCELEVRAAVVALDVQLDLVGEVEATLGLDDVLEHRQHVAVLAVELELDLGLVPLEILGAHDARVYALHADPVIVRPAGDCACRAGQTRFSLIFAAFPMRSRR